MSEENKEILNEESVEETTEVVEEVVEEVTQTLEEAAEEVVEAVEEVVEEAADTVEETAEAVEDSAEETAEAATEEVIDEAVEFTEEVKKSKTGLVVGIIVAVLVVIIAILAVLFGKNLFNKYNRMGYIDVSGKTIAEIADQSGYELADFLSEYGLPADMPGNTSESAAYYMIPVKNIAQMYGMDFAQMKEYFGLGDEITEDTPWGEAEGEVTVGKYVGEENIDQFKEQYGFGDEVTAETKWKEIRNKIDQQARDERIAAEKAAKEAPAEDEAVVDEEAPVEEAAEETAEEATEAPAEEKAE